MSYLFIGERPSALAEKMGVGWRDGRLCAKQLFEALDACGIEPRVCLFDNIYISCSVGPEIVCEKAIRRIRYRLRRGWKLVAMGKKVERVLGERGCEAIPIVHPAARGRIRKKERYTQHVKEALNVL